MFNSLESFSVFFFTVLTLIVFAIIFEDKLVALEERRERNHRNKRYNKSRCNGRSK